MNALSFIRLVLSLVVLAPVALAAPRVWQYKHSVNPERAEEILAGIALKPRFYNSDWIRILGTQKKGTNYTVQPGDNLWGIAGRTFGNPRLWPKLWEVNPQVTNPHELTVGQILVYYREGDEPPTIHIPLVKLSRKLAGVNDLDNAVIVQTPMANRYRPSINLISEEEVVGEITGSYTEKDGFDANDELYINFTKEVKAGETYSIVHFERSLKDRTQVDAPVIGNIARLIGDIRVVGKGERLARAELIAQMAVIKRGDKIVPLQKIVEFETVINPPDDFQARIVMGEEPEHRTFMQGDLVMLNKGKTDGMAEGYRFRVYRDTDPNTKSKNSVEPFYTGEIQVVYVAESASVGFITANSETITIGDTLVPFQSFPPKPIPPEKLIRTIDLDEPAPGTLPPTR